jgi:hypothetical protein
LADTVRLVGQPASQLRGQGGISSSGFPSPRAAHARLTPSLVFAYWSRDESVRVAREVEEQIEHLGLDMHRDAVAPELVRASIDLEAAEAVAHAYADAAGVRGVAHAPRAEAPIADHASNPALAVGRPERSRSILGQSASR